MERPGGVYQIRCLSTGKLYVGSSYDLRERRRSHFYDLRMNRHGNVHLQRAYNKYGQAKFEFSILLICAPEHLLFFEQRTLDILKPEFNLTPTAGSPRGYKHSQQALEKMRIKGRSRRHSPESKAAISAALRGLKKSPEHVKKIVEAKVNFTHTAETKRRISLSTKRALAARKHETSNARL